MTLQAEVMGCIVPTVASTLFRSVSASAAAMAAAAEEEAAAMAAAAAASFSTTCQGLTLIHFFFFNLSRS